MEIYRVIAKTRKVKKTKYSPACFTIGIYIFIFILFCHQIVANGGKVFEYAILPTSMGFTNCAFLNRFTGNGP